jgi:poly(3-hydroxybutyrate) depolymerase
MRVHPLKSACVAAVIALCAFCAVLVSESGAATPQATRGALQATPVGSSQVLAVPYHAWNNKARFAVVVLPGDYVPGSGEELPCLVQPHGRKASPLGPAARWGDLPTTERFMVICPDSSGRRDPVNSWAVAGQLQDIAEIADVVEASIPWVRIDHQRMYVLGISMGGHETLCTVARYPDVFAGAICVDGNANLAARYREFAKVGMTSTRPLMRREVGGTPSQVPWLYQRRSATPFARTLATCGVPIAIWWSKDDKIGYNQAKTQTGYLYRRIKSIAPEAPVVQVIGTGAHGTMLSLHPEAAIDFLRPGGVWRTLPEAPATWSYRSWLGSTEVWGYRFATKANLRKMWRTTIAPGRIDATCPAALTVQVPYGEGLPVPAVVTVNGIAKEVTPVDGYITIRFRAGTSTATFPTA